MTEMSLEPDAEIPQAVRSALQESRQRWRHFVTLGADLAFETDQRGRFVLILPEHVLGWSSRSLIGQPADLLLGDDGAVDGFNPFHPQQEIRRRRCWIRRGDGTMAMLAVSAAPILGSQGEYLGARGVGVDSAWFESPPASLAGRLRHGEVLDHVLTRVGQETEADRMMDVALWSVVHALQAEGAAVLGAIIGSGPAEVIHECGPGADAIADEAARLLLTDQRDPRCAINPDGRPVLAVPCPSRFSPTNGFAIWRARGGRPWADEEATLAASATSVVKMILDYEAMHQSMAHQARTDPLTGLCNRRAFLEEMGRYFVRLHRDPAPGTLMYLDVDGFKAVNDQLGHAAGDGVLMALAEMLRRLVRPSDLIARLGGDEFAVWLMGTDHMTAAERADHLCRAAPAAFRDALPQEIPGLGLSIGIASRHSGSCETLQALMSRADLAMYEVKRSGRGHWRVALLDSEP